MIGHSKHAQSFQPGEAGLWESSKIHHLRRNETEKNVLYGLQEMVRAGPHQARLRSADRGAANQNSEAWRRVGVILK